LLKPNQPRPTTATVIPAAGRMGSPAPSSAEPDDAFAPVEVVPSAGVTDCAANAAAPRTVRRDRDENPVDRRALSPGGGAAW